MGTGCTVGDKLFADFTFTNDGTLAGLDAGAINVLTSTTPQGNEVLTFIGGLTANGGVNGGFITGIINYTVSTITGAALIEDLSLSVGPVFSAGLGPNSASAVEYACVGVNVSCNAQNASFVLNAVPNGPADHTVFSPMSSLSVSKRLTINAAALNLVTVQSLTNEVSQVPEPGTWLTLAAGLVLIYVRRSKRILISC